MMPMPLDSDRKARRPSLLRISLLNPIQLKIGSRAADIEIVTYFDSIANEVRCSSYWLVPVGFGVLLFLTTIGLTLASFATANLGSKRHPETYFWSMEW